MRVFSKQQFIKAEGQEIYEKCKSWVDEIDGKIVVGGEVDGYASDKTWEVETSSELVMEYDFRN